MIKKKYCTAKKPTIDNVRAMVNQAAKESDHIKWYAARVTILNMIMLGDL